MPAASSRRTPETEDQHQASLFAWASIAQRQYPELALMFHVPNGGFRRPVEAKILAGMGVKPGVPDVVLPVKRMEYAGLWIELKRPGPHKVSASQRWWIEELARAGHRTMICVGWEAAREAIVAYLDSPR
jgi:hypothetical protein